MDSSEMYAKMQAGVKRSNLPLDGIGNVGLRTSRKLNLNSK